MKPFASVEVVILRGVDQIEARHPTSHAERENERRKIDMSGLRDPSANRRNGERQSKKKMGRGGETFGDRIETDNHQRKRRQNQREAIDRARGKKKTR